MGNKKIKRINILFMFSVAFLFFPDITARQNPEGNFHKLIDMTCVSSRIALVFRDIRLLPGKRIRWFLSEVRITSPRPEDRFTSV